MLPNGTRLNCVAVKNVDNFQNSKQMENTEKYRIVDNEGNEVLADVSVSLLDFIQEVKHMMGLYGASSYTRAEQTRDKLAEQLDDIMRLGNER